jgi:hypothetical protein
MREIDTLTSTYIRDERDRREDEEGELEAGETIEKMEDEEQGEERGDTADDNIPHDDCEDDKHDQNEDPGPG